MAGVPGIAEIKVYPKASKVALAFDASRTSATALAEQLDRLGYPPQKGAALVLWLRRSDSRAQRLGLAAIIGGATSNVIDRLDDGAVTDFLDLRLASHHWPVFNIADVMIMTGVVVMVASRSCLFSQRAPFKTVRAKG